MTYARTFPDAALTDLGRFSARDQTARVSGEPKSVCSASVTNSGSFNVQSSPGNFCHISKTCRKHPARCWLTVDVDEFLTTVQTLKSSDFSEGVFKDKCPSGTRRSLWKINAVPGKRHIKEQRCHLAADLGNGRRQEEFTHSLKRHKTVQKKVYFPPRWINFSQNNLHIYIYIYIIMRLYS